MNQIKIGLLTLLPAVLMFPTATVASEVSLKKTDVGYEVLIDGKLFAGYVTNFQGTPIVWPIIGPNGHRMTRDFPMEKRRDGSEAHDHPHHRSLWFTHGEVNNANFWHLNKQKVVHQNFLKAECDGKTAVLVTENFWLDEKDESLCSDERTLRFGMDGKLRYIDFDITVKAVQDEVVFKETKEGTFAVRVPGTVDVKAKTRNSDWGGHIVNAEGHKDEDAWGKRSAWVDYYGPVEGETAGIAILNHPTSFRYPTFWHVRDYGLFAANPFGDHDFDKQNIAKGTGEFKMNKGESFTLRYRVLFHEGDAESAGIAEAFERYKK